MYVWLMEGEKKESLVYQVWKFVIHVYVSVGLRHFRRDEHVLYVRASSSCDTCMWHTCMWIDSFVCMYVCAYVCMYVCMYAYTHMQHARAQTHTCSCIKTHPCTPMQYPLQL